MRKIFFIVILFMLALITGCKTSTTTKKEENKEVVFTYALIEGNDTIEINTNWVDAGVKIYFNNVEATNVTSSNNIDQTKLGNYRVEYKANFNNKNYLVVRYVSVIDETIPQLLLKPGIDTIKVGENWVDAGVVITDNSNNYNAYTINGSVNQNKVGRYIITYTVKDLSGNIGTTQRVVNVVE